MTRGVLILIGEAAVDLLLLPWRIVLSLLRAHRWREETRRLILSEATHAAPDPTPPR